MSRDDLLALTPESLAALANLGLVKRAQRELDAGQGPTIEEDARGVVTGKFADGVIARLPPGVTLRDAPCTCGATTVCRHRVAVALAYRAKHRSTQETPPADEVWSPGTFDDDTLLALLGKRAMERARTQVTRGVLVEIARGTKPSARLPTCTVSFLVPRDAAYARCDCAQVDRCEHVAIAAWAFREADATDKDALRKTVELHGGNKSSVDHEALAAAKDLAHHVLSEGAVNVPADAAQRFARVRSIVQGAGQVWIGALIDDLEEQLDAYRARSARYSATTLTALLIELRARSSAAGGKGELPPRYVLGSDEARETLLDHVRLVSLGARLDADGTSREAEIFLADPDSATVLVLRKRWDYKEKEEPEDGPALGRRTIATGVSLLALAQGQMVSRAVKRHANHSVVLGQGRGGKTSVTPQTGDFDALPAPILVRDFAAHATELRARPPRALRPRVLADAMHAVAVKEVRDLCWAPGDQTLHAELVDANGTPMRLARRYRRAAPNALEAIANGLRNPALRFVTGEIRFGFGVLEIDPVAIVTKEVVVPDLEKSVGPLADVPLARDSSRSSLWDALETASACLEEGCHLGLRTIRVEWRQRAKDAAEKLQAVGLTSVADRMQRLAAERAVDSSAEAWLSAALRLSLAREAASAS